MPFTLSHTVAVLPLRKHCPHNLDLLALILGSMTPDFPYYWHDFILASKSHSLLGSVFVCLPIGLTAYFVLKYFARQIADYSCSPFREFFQNLSTTRSRPAIIAASVVIGAWTHNLWDAFTHSKGWFVTRFPILKIPVQEILPISVKGADLIPLYSIMQHTSTLLGLVIIALVLRKHFQLDQIKKSLPGALALVTWLAIVSVAVIAFIIQFLPQLSATISEPLLIRQYIFYAVVALVRNAVILFALCVLWKHVIDRLGSNRPTGYN